MKNILDKLALLLFDCIAFAKGYRFRRVVSHEQQKEADVIYDDDGYSFPDYIKSKIQKYKVGTTYFIAYHKDTPVGTVGISNPEVINRAYEHLLVDKNGEHHEIQSLSVKRKYRDGAQFVMLGLLRKVYGYSVDSGIKTWSACGNQAVYLTMRRYCKDIQVIPIDFNAVNTLDNPVTRHLLTHKIIETCFIMPVTTFSPWDILRGFLRKKIRKALMELQKDRRLGTAQKQTNIV
jgi:hypothetical protein